MAKRRNLARRNPPRQRRRVKVWTASIAAIPKQLDRQFVTNAQRLGTLLRSEIWFLSHGHSQATPWESLDHEVFNRFVSQRSKLPVPETTADGAMRSRMALLIDSPGGFSVSAYRLAALLQKQCGGFTAIVPRYAKSAATLLCCGANSIVLGQHAELGPLDVQIYDADTEEQWVSALDEVQAVEALEQSAIDSAIRIMIYLRERTGKRINTLMPHALQFAADVTKPLFDKIDSVRFSRQSRRLQEAQDYAERLLRIKFSTLDAKAIARDLVRNYAIHTFVIDKAEAKQLGRRQQGGPVGLQVDQRIVPAVEQLLDWFYENLPGKTIIGNIVEDSQ